MKPQHSKTVECSKSGPERKFCTKYATLGEKEKSQIHNLKEPQKGQTKPKVIRREKIRLEEKQMGE